MIIRKLMPREGFRPFAQEVGKIVLGVLIALGLGVIATEIGWKVEVAIAREALAFELGETVGQADERVNFSPCVERRLDQITRIVEKAEKDGRLPAIGNIANPPFRTWNRGVWDSAVSSQTAAHFPREEAAAFVGLNEFVSILSESNVRELDVWTKLYGLVGPGRPLSAPEVAALRAAIGEARLVNRTMGMASVRATQFATAYDLEYDVATARDYSDSPLTDFPICKPIPPEAPGTYGHAPLQDVIRRSKENPFTRTPGRG